jgi:putative transposase
VTEVGPRLGIAPTCAALGVPRATYYRRRRPQNAPPRRRSFPRALTDTERMAVLAALHEPRFVDLAPAEVYATLLTKLLGPAKWTYFYLYVMLDVFSRYVVGWMVAHRESATLAEQSIHETCARQGIERGQLTIHADRGAAMTSKPVALLLADLGVTKTHARPHVSDDNPFSEAHFKTLKYRPAFPGRFGSIQDARAHCHVFFRWYNTEHHHAGLGLLTPFDVHHGLSEQRIAARATVLATAYAAHRERFSAGRPHPPGHPTEVWINPPKTRSMEETCGFALPRGSVLDHARPRRLVSAYRSDRRRPRRLEAPA